jgi:hypothetical protein
MVIEFKKEHVDVVPDFFGIFYVSLMPQASSHHIFYAKKL